jgi:hypothetical protein
MLKVNLQKQQLSDFQQYPSWRLLTQVIASELSHVTGQFSPAVQTVITNGYRSEVVDGCRSEGHEVFHPVVEAEPETLRNRIERDEVERGAIEWLMKHLVGYEQQRQWMRGGADFNIDTTAISSQKSAVRLLNAVSGLNCTAAATCGLVSSASLRTELAGWHARF